MCDLKLFSSNVVVYIYINVDLGLSLLVVYNIYYIYFEFKMFQKAKTSSKPVDFFKLFCYINIVIEDIGTNCFSYFLFETSMAVFISK